VLVPGIEQKFKSDIKTIKMFCQLAMPQHVPAFDEIEKQFLTEFDYTKEAENLDRARNNIIKRWSQNDADNNTSNSKQAPTLSDRVFQWLSVLTNTQNAEIEVVVPKPYTNYCSTHKRVLEVLVGG
jgi:predicted unusual protein kinase regulating ubiquinone biosynthesis (AarF/ABC1/UbiB family)